VTPAAARVRVGDKDFGAARTLDLPEGDHVIEIYGEGIKTMRVPVKVAKDMTAPAPIVAEVEPPALVLALSGARATLDGKLVTAQGRIPIEPGDHRMEFFQGLGAGVAEFTIAPGALPVIKKAAAQGMFLTAVAVLGKTGKVFGARKGILGAADLVDVPAEGGLELTGLTEQPQAMRVSDGTEIRSYDLTSAVAPTIAIFVADPGRVDLAVLSNEEGAIVQINGKQTGVIQKGQRLEQLAPGVYKVKVSKPGFLDVPERTVTLAKGRGSREQFDLKAAVGSLRIVGAPVRAKVLLDGKEVGDLRPNEPFVAGFEPGRHRVGVKADSFLSTDRDVDLKAGTESALSWRDLAVGLGSVQLSASGGLSVFYTPPGGGPPKSAQPGILSLPVGDYTFKALIPNGPEQTQSVTVRQGQSVAVAFAPPAKGPTQPDAPKPGAGTATPTAVSLYDDKWKDDDGWKKLDSGRQADLPGSASALSFKVRRRGGIGGMLGGRPGWLYLVSGPNFVRFELSNDKLTWWVTNGANRDKKAGDAPVPKDVEEVRIEIGNDAITHTIGSANARIPAAELGFTSFAGGHFRFRGPISIKGLSAGAR
jgi:hypothetical protein